MYNDTKKRKYNRIEKPYTARLRVKQYEDQEMSSPDWDTAVVENLSAGGMLFNYNKNLEIGSLLDLKLSISESKAAISCIGRVIRIEEFQYLLRQVVQPLNSVFRIAIEFTEIEEQERKMISITAKKALRKEAKGKHFSLVKIRAIVLDDDYVLRTLIYDVLKDRGYEVHGSFEPFFCPIFLDSKCPCPVETHCTNIIITDINMHGMTGFEFIEHQKRNGCKVQNIAMMSGRWTDEEIEHAKRLGCHIFKKPFNFDEIKKWLDDCEKKLDPDNKLSDLPIRMIKSEVNK
jgi:CheY-like chemotaxis protein